MRLIDADALLMNMNLAIAVLEGTMKNLGLQDDAECQMELKAYRDIRDGIKDEPTAEPTAQPGTNCSEFPNSSDTIYRQAAIEALRECQTYLFDERDPDKKIELRSAERAIEDLPAAQPEIIRCKDCKYWRDDHTCHEHSLVSPMCANEYCSRAERRTE